MGDQYELLHWEVILTMITTTLGLVAFASALERYCLRAATVLETVLLWLAALGLLWTSYWTEAVGFILLLTAPGSAAVSPRFPGYRLKSKLASCISGELGLKTAPVD